MIGLPLVALTVMLEQIRAGKSFVIKVDGDVVEYEGDFTLKSLYEALDCDLIEVVQLKDDLILICDEEALCRAYPIVNLTATNLAYGRYSTANKIIGKCIICQSSKLP